MSADWQWQPPEWLGQGAAWVASLVVAGGAKPVFDWWQGRSKDQREAKKLEIDAATLIREELRKDRLALRKELEQRDDEIEAVRREMYELLGKVAALTAENHAVRADRHRLLNWITVFYGDLQRRWDRAGLPMDQFPGLPEWITHPSPDGPTASFRDSS